MTDNAEKNPGQKPGQSSEHSGQQQQKNPQDVSKKDPSQKAIRSRAISRGNRTRAASAALPKL